MAYNPYSYSPYQTTPFLTEEQKKKKKEDEQKAILERIQTNRLYLKKVKKECALESFDNLQKFQLFLFEVLIENLEVAGGSDLSLMTDKKELTYVTARIQVLNSPYLEICEKDIVLEGRDVQSDYFKTVGQAELSNAYHTGKPQEVKPPTPTPIVPTPTPTFGPPTEDEFNAETNKVKWTKTSGKSCLFSLTPLQVVQDLEDYPVVVQVVRRLLAATGVGAVPSTTDKAKEASKTEKDMAVDKTKLEGKSSKTTKDETSKPDDDISKYEPLGYAFIKLPEEFRLSVLQACKEGVLLPVSNIHRETCDLENVFGVKKGTVSVYIRLSTFGPAIITNFHTVGTETKYAYKPSAVVDNFQAVRKVDDSRLDELKPIIAEEDKTVGISVMKTEDATFKKPILWKVGGIDCGCTFEGQCLYPTASSSTLYTEMAPMLLPLSSDLSLCRDVIRPKNFQRRKKFETVGNICHWHNLVSKEIQNGPRETCGCISKVCLPTDKKKGDRDNTKEVIKGKPRGVCTCSPSPDILYLRGGNISKHQDGEYKNPPLGQCYFMARKPFGPENKPNEKEKSPINDNNYEGTKGKPKKKKSCCDCCHCGSRKDSKKKTSKDKHPLGYNGWPSPRSFVRKDPFGWESPESKKVRGLLEEADKLLEEDLKSTRKDKPRHNCGCISIDTRCKSTRKKGKPEECESRSKKPKGLLKPNASSSDLSSGSDIPLMKLKPLPDDLPSIKGFGLTSTKTGCGCPCPDIKKAFQCKTLFPY